MESHHHGQAYETCLLLRTQRYLRRHDLHVRPSAHEADELLLLHSAVETDENRTRIVRVQTGCSPVELQPQSCLAIVSGLVPRCGYRELHPNLELGTLASCCWTMTAFEPKSGVAPKPTVYETVALLLSYKGTEAASATSARTAPGSSGRIRTSIFPINSGTPYR